MAEKPPTNDDDLHRLPTDQDLNRLQRSTVLYYLHETNPDNGLVRDKTDPTAPCSIAAVGLALANRTDEDSLDLDSLYPYTADRLDWLASNLDRPSNSNEAAEDYGQAPNDILAFIAWGMDRELRKVFDLVRAKFE